MIYRLYYAAYHKNRLLLALTDDEAANRFEQIIAIKPEPELWTRLLAFQPVRDPSALPLPVQQADAARQQAYAAWQQAYAAYQQTYAAWEQAAAAYQQTYAAWEQAYAAYQQTYAAYQQTYAA